MMKYLGILWSIPLVIVVIVMGFLLFLSYATLNIDSDTVNVEPKQLSFEVFHDGSYIPIIDREEPDRYAVKLYEYYDKKDVARAKTFFR